MFTYNPLRAMASAYTCDMEVRRSMLLTYRKAPANATHLDVHRYVRMSLQDGKRTDMDAHLIRILAPLPMGSLILLYRDRGVGSRAGQTSCLLWEGDGPWPLSRPPSLFPLTRQVIAPSSCVMPTWSKEFPTPPWPKPHIIQLENDDVYDAAQKAAGSDDPCGHKPLAFVGSAGEEHRRAGVHGENLPEHESHDGTADGTKAGQNYEALSSGEDWREELRGHTKVVTVRDVKKASLE